MVAPAQPGDRASRQELMQTVRTNLLGLVLSLLVLGLIAAGLVRHFEAELAWVTEAVFAHFGIVGIAVALFITDAFVSPLPPDSLLFLIAASPYHANWPPLIAFLGCVSTVAGMVGYGLGRVFSRLPVLKRTLQKTRERSRERIEKFGAWAIVLGALTPVPFSITCWTAGIMHVRFRDVWWPTLLRIPRYMLYYWVIATMPTFFS